MAENALTTCGRHWLLWPDGEGRTTACGTAQSLLPQADDAMVRELVLSNVPAIVRRQTGARAGWVQVGFSSHLYVHGSRLRVDAELPLAHIARSLSPFEVPGAMKPDFARRALVEDLLALGRACGVPVGFYGSTALQIVTGLPYLRPGSDVDVYLACNDKNRLSVFSRGLGAIQQRHAAAVDAEFEHEGYGIKLLEYLGSSATVLGKGLHEAILFQKGKSGTLHPLP